MLANLRRGQAEARHVIHLAAQSISRRGSQLHQRAHRVGHRHKRDARLWAHKARIRLALSRGVDHLRAVIARSPGGQRERAQQPRKAHTAKIQRHRRLCSQLAVMATVIDAQHFAIELVAAVHGARLVPLELTHPRIELLALPVGHAVDRNRAGENKLDGARPPLALLRGQPQQPQRPLHIDLVRHLRRNLAARGEQRGQVVDHLDLILAHQPRQQLRIHQIALHMVGHPAQFIGQRVQVQAHQPIGRP